METAARNLRLKLQVLHASADSDFDTVFTSSVQRRAGGLVIGGDPFFNSRTEQLGTLALRHASIIRSASCKFRQRGFSQTTCLPAAAAATVASQ